MADGASVPTGFLRRKAFGKIPIIYIIGVFVLMLAIVAYRMKANAPTDTTDTTAATDAAAASDDVLATGNTDSLATGGTVTVPPASNPIVGNAAISDNQTWLRKGVEFLGSRGVGAGNAQVALQAYLNGDQLSYQQGVWRDSTVKELGLPPEAFQAGTTLGKPAAPAKQQGPLPRGHRVVGPNDNTYAKLAQLYYNNASAGNVAFIKAANTPGPLGDGNGPFSVGTIVQIPKYVTPVYFTSTKTINTAREIAVKNHISVNDLNVLNPGMTFPVKPKTRVRVR